MPVPPRRGCWAVLLTTVLLGCHGVDVGEDNPDVAFQGDAPAEAETPDAGTGSGLSDCFLLDRDSCPAEQSCVPTADNRRVCVPSASRAAGARCSTHEAGSCGPALLCVGDADVARCRDVCAPEGDDCGDEVCRLLMVVDGERVGLCGP